MHDDLDCVRSAVTRLTERHEAGRVAPWSVVDAPEKFVKARLRAVVGIEIQIESIEAKAKLSQNRSDADRLGVIAGLRQQTTNTSDEVAGAMQRALDG